MNKVKFYIKGKLNFKMINKKKLTDQIYTIYFYTIFLTYAPKDDPQL